MTKDASKKTSSRKAQITKSRPVRRILGKIFYWPLKILRTIFWPLRPIGRYVKGAWQELRQVTWPNRKTSVQLTLAVIIFTVILSAFIAGLDYGFEQLVKRIIL